MRNSPSSPRVTIKEASSSLRGNHNSSVSLSPPPLSKRVMSEKNVKASSLFSSPTNSRLQLSARGDRSDFSPTISSLSINSPVPSSLHSPSRSNVSHGISLTSQKSFIIEQQKESTNQANKEKEAFYGRIRKQIKEEVRRTPKTLKNFRPAPEVFGAIWSVIRESMNVCEIVPRGKKEIVFACVGQINGCSRIYDPHLKQIPLTLVNGEEYAKALAAEENLRSAELGELVKWVRSTQDGQLRDPPFEDNEAPEIISTTLLAHYLCRVSNLLQKQKAISKGPSLGKAFGSLFKTKKSRPKLAPEQKFEPSKSLTFFQALLWEDDDENIIGTELDYSWASPMPHITNAFIVWTRSIKNHAKQFISDKVVEVTEEIVNDYYNNLTDLEKKDFGSDDGLAWRAIFRQIQGALSSPRERTTAKLIIRIALSHYRKVSKKEIAKFKELWDKDEQNERFFAAVLFGCLLPVKQMSTSIAALYANATGTISIASSQEHIASPKKDHVSFSPVSHAKFGNGSVIIEDIKRSTSTDRIHKMELAFRRRSPRGEENSENSSTEEEEYSS